MATHICNGNHKIYCLAIPLLHINKDILIDITEYTSLNDDVILNHHQMVWGDVFNSPHCCTSLWKLIYSFFHGFKATGLKSILQRELTYIDIILLHRSTRACEMSNPFRLTCTTSFSFACALVLSIAWVLDFDQLSI